MTVEIAVSLDHRHCMGSSVSELAGDCPGEKQWFRHWLETRLESKALVLLGKRTHQAMHVYGLKLRERYPQSRWVVLSRQGPGIAQSLEAGFHEGFEQALILGGLSVFEEALSLGVVDRVWIARIATPRSGDLIFPMEYLQRFRLQNIEEKDAFTVEIYVKL